MSESTVRVYNRGTRSFIHGKYVLAPRSFLNVPEELAKKWFAMFEADVMEASLAQREIGGAQAELNAAKETIAKLEAEIAALKAGAKPGKKLVEKDDPV